MNRSGICQVALLFTFLAASGSPLAAHRAKEIALYDFCQSPCAYEPFGALTLDSVGNLYGAAGAGAGGEAGAIYELTPSAAGWNYSVLYSFQGAPDGQEPTGSLVFDGDGNLYGTTSRGGTNGEGTIFELSPSEGGEWTETVLYSFGGYASDGTLPQAGVLFDGAGNLYGTTYGGGISSVPCPSYGCGTVFELSPLAGGPWTESILYMFQAGSDGYAPESVLTMDGGGNLYGTTLVGGGPGCRNGSSYLGCGTVFELSGSGGGWAETVLYAFQGKRDGAGPLAGVILDSSGNLYGTAEFGGVSGLKPCSGGGSGGCGAVFELSQIGGEWSESVIHSFRGYENGGEDGINPTSSLTTDPSGSLYGTTMRGGCCQSNGGYGTAFRLTKAGDGKWTEQRYPFSTRAEGYYPLAGLVLDSDGNAYGTTTSGGGESGNGVIFEITPPN